MKMVIPTGGLPGVLVDSPRVTGLCLSVIIRGRNVITGTMVTVLGLLPLRADAWKVKVNHLFVHFVL